MAETASPYSPSPGPGASSEDQMKRIAVFMVLLAVVAGCTGVPEGLVPVSPFDAGRYLGRWYEIARLDHPFERNLTHVHAEYSRGDGEEILVLNRGFDRTSGQWREIRGMARLSGEKSVGSLEVSFFRPFWGGYHVIALDRDAYGYAMVAGPNRSYLWILSRERTLDSAILAELVSKARAWGFDVDRLIYVSQEMPVTEVSLRFAAERENRFF